MGSRRARRSRARRGRARAVPASGLGAHRPVLTLPATGMLGPVEGSSYARGVRVIAPIAVAGATFAASFGVLARASHMGRLAPIVMSATPFAGSAQFAATSVL